MTTQPETTAVEALTRRIETLVGDIDQLTDPVARGLARETLQAVLDLHGLGLAHMVALIARAERGGPDLLAELGRNRQTRALLLLHGLHPEDPETRLHPVIEHLRASGVGIELTGISHRTARVRVSAPGHNDSALQQQIEAMVLEAVPELDAIEIEPDDRCEPSGILAATTV